MTRVVWISCVLFGLASTVSADSAVESAIKRGQQYLYSQLNAQGNWETAPAFNPAKFKEPLSTEGPQWTGRTALATYALVKSGQNPAADPRLAKAVDFLKKSPSPTGTYALAFRCLVWEELPKTDEIKRVSLRDAQRLLTGVNDHGLYTYIARYPKAEDMSNSQVAALGLSAAAEAGYEVPLRFWKATDQAWRRRQMGDGAWSYAPDQPDDNHHKPHPGMTAAGIATLLLAREGMTPPQPPADEPDGDKNLDAATGWLTANFNSVFGFTFVFDRSLYTLYAVERAAVASGIKRFGKDVWYQRAIEYLLPRQQQDGRWVGGVDAPEDTVVGTAFALTVLSFANAPVAFTKLDYGDGGQWNLQSRDVARVTRWTAREAETLQRWQVAKLDGPAEDLLDAPVIFASGKKPLVFSDEQVTRLTNAVDRGALLVFNAGGQSSGFADSVKKLGLRMYPGAVWRDLGKEHSIFAAQQFNATRWKFPPALQGLSNGTRELMVLSDRTDLSVAWNMPFIPPKPEAYELSADLLQYAGGAGSLVTPLVKNDGASLKSVLVRHLGATGEEKRAWPATVEWFREKGVDLRVEPTTLTSQTLPDETALLHVASMDAKWNAEQVGVLKHYVEVGGTILFEVPANATPGNDALESFITRTWPAATPFDLTDFKADGDKPLALSMRSYSPGSRRNVTESLKCWKAAGGRVVLCKVDLSAGLAGLRHHGIVGLQSPSARDLVQALIRK